MGNPRTIHILEDIRKYHKHNIMFLKETMNDVEYVQNVSKRLHYTHNFVLPANGRSGGPGIFYDDEVSYDFVGPPSTYLIDIMVSDGSLSFWLTYVYGNPRRK